MGEERTLGQKWPVFKIGEKFVLQATSLSFIVAASQIGLDLQLITRATGAALVAAGLLSVLIFPLIALTLLRQEGASSSGI